MIYRGWMPHLPLSGHISVTSGNTEEERIVRREDVGGDQWVVWLGRCPHGGKNFLREGFCDST